MDIDKIIQKYKVKIKKENESIDRMSYYNAKSDEEIVQLLEELKFLRQWKQDIVNEFCKRDANSIEELIFKVREGAINKFAEDLHDAAINGAIDEYYIDGIAEMEKSLGEIEIISKNLINNNNNER